MQREHTEKELIQRIIEKDEKALMEVYRRFNTPLFHFIYRQLKDRYIAEELTQDVFFDFIERLRDFRGESSLKTFIFSIAKYKVIDVIRKKKIKKILFSAIPEHVVEKLMIVFDDEIEKQELREKIKETFNRLPNDYGVVLRLKYIDRQKVVSIAERLRLSFKATESLLFRARRAFVAVFTKLE